MQTADPIANLIANAAAHPIQERKNIRLPLLLLLACTCFGWGGAAVAQGTLAVGYSFPALVTVGSSSAPQTVTVKIQTSGTVSQVKMLTGGAPNLDFALSGGTCAAGVSYTAGQTCSASVVLTAMAPGIRMGAVVLTDANGNSLGSQLVYGVGVGPLSVMTAGEITTVAGNGGYAGVGSGTRALDAVIREPVGMATDEAGNFYYSDNGNDLIGRVDAAGNLTVIAGTGSPGFSPNGTLAAQALLSAPSGITVDGAGNVYFADSGNSVVREIVKATGLIETVAGTGVSGYTGDGGAATIAKLNGPQGVAIDSTGNLYIADSENSVVRKVSAATGKITTFAGNGTIAFGGDGGQATSASLAQPFGVFAWSDGSVYIADFLNNAVRRVDSTGIITTVAGTGNGLTNYTGDGGPATSAQLNHPASVAVDAAGDIFFSDSDNDVVRKVNGATKIITTLAGSAVAGSSGDGYDADNGAVTLNKPYGVALDASGDVYVADRLGLVIREILGATGRIQYKDIKVTNTSPPVPQGVDNDGNASLHLSSIAAASNSAIDPASTTCSTTAAMAPGATCVIGAEFKPTTVGSPINGSITIASDSSNTPVTIDVYGNSLSIEPTTTTLASSVNPSAVGAAVTFTATVSSALGNSTDTVQFLDGTTVLGGVAVVVNPTTLAATYTTTNLALGSHSITAVFSGDNSNRTSTSSALIQVVHQTSTLSLVSNDNPAHVYDSITFTVTASETPAGGTMPTGSVVFSIDGTPSPAATLTNGVASYNTSLLAAGKHNIAASYAGDTNNLPGTSNTLVQVVNVATTATTLTSSNTTVPLTTAVTFTATVSGGSSSTPTGNVVFKDGAATIGTTAVNNAGAATFTTSSLAAGSHQITAVYQGDNDFAGSTSAALTEAVQKIATSAVVTSSLNPADAGAAVVFTVSVAAASTTTPNVAITGQVSLMEGSTVLGTGTLAASATGPAKASAAITVSSLAPGSHAITAVYAGDTNYVTSTSTGLLESITLATSTISLAANPTAAVATKPVTLTATLTSNGGTPGGSVSFLDGTVTIGSGSLSKGVATFTTSALAVGTHSITAVYGGDAKDGVSTSGAVIVTVSAASTAVALTPSQSPTNFGQPFTLTAKVTGDGGVPTGSVAFFDGATALQSVAVNAGGVAAFATSTLTVGSHTFTAKYAGDANDAASTSPALTVVVLETVTLTLTSTSPNPSVARSNVHFVATIAAQQGSAPTGRITFKDGATLLGTGSISGSTASFDTAALTVGTHSIVASYAGNGTTEAIDSAAYPQVVNSAGATVTLASSANPATFGSAITFTASAASTAGTPTGTVKFQDGGVTIGSGTLSSTGVATFSTSTLTAGAHSIVAAYQGDANDEPASSSTLQQVVERTSTITLASSENPLPTLTAVTITATVADGGTTTPTGSVTFMQDSVAVATVTVGSAGTATLKVASLAAGAHSFAASYSGDAINLASVSTTLAETVQLRPTTNALTTSASSLTGGEQITLISIVRWNGDGSTTPTGTVTFLNGTTTLATAPVDTTGVATVTVLLAGTSASVSSAYGGDANYAASTSAPTLVTIGPAANFTLGANPPTFKLVSKQHQDLTITIASMKEFTDTLSMGCLGLPQAATCTFSKDQAVLPAGGQVTVTLTVDTGNPLLAGAQAKLDAPTLFTGSKTALACFLPGGLLLGLLGLRARRLRGLRMGGLLLLLLSLAGVSMVLTGCGGVNMGGTPAGTYTFEISAHGATGVSQSIPVTMTVTQ